MQNRHIWMEKQTETALTLKIYFVKALDRDDKTYRTTKVE